MFCIRTVLFVCFCIILYLYGFSDLHFPSVNKSGGYTLVFSGINGEKLSLLKFYTVKDNTVVRQESLNSKDFIRCFHEILEGIVFHRSIPRPRLEVSQFFLSCHRKLRLFNLDQRREWKSGEERKRSSSILMVLAEQYIFLFLWLKCRLMGLTWERGKPVTFEFKVVNNIDYSR